MEQLNPAPLINPAIRPPGMQGMSAQGFSGMPMRPQNFSSNVGFANNEQEEKKKEFARGIFVSGFEKCVTTAMIQHHFSIKTISGLKHPTTKHKESKGFAFIYYGSEDDALFVKKTLDRTAILKEKIRITRTVISENLSKMMFKLNTAGLQEKQIQQNETKYFNDENLEKEVERIIKPLFGTSVEVNKITIPHSKTDKKPLRYARVFFYVSNIKEANNIANRSIQIDQIAGNKPNQYETILNYISDLINKDQVFSKIAKSQIYEYTKKNQSNVLHIKGIHHNPKEDPAALAEEIKEFVSNQNPQWNIVNVYAAIYSQMGAWANVTFSSYEETLQAYETLKNARPKFRDTLIYGSLRNVKDPRTIVISEVRKDATEALVKQFLNELASKSQKSSVPGEEPIRKYEYFSFNIIESKKFYKTDTNETQGITSNDTDKVLPSWIEINQVPRRLIIHFFRELSEEEIKDLTNDIRVTPGNENIFLIGDSKKQLRSNHQKGHVNKDGLYIKHTQLKGKKKTRGQNRGDRNQIGRKPNDNMRGGMRRDVNFSAFSFGAKPGVGGVPKLNPQMGGGMPQFRGIPQVGAMGINNLGGMASLGGLNPGSVNLPGMAPRPFNFPQNQQGPNLGSQPPQLAQQPPISGGFKPLPGMPGNMVGFPGAPMAGLPVMSLPGMNPIKPLGFPTGPSMNPISGIPIPKPQQPQ